MANLIVMNKKYDNYAAIANLINYINNSNNNVYSVSLGTIGDTSEEAIQSFEKVQNYWNKTNGKRIHHFVISFEKDIEPNIDQLRWIAYCVTKFFSKEKKFQTFCGVHIEHIYNEQNKHIHFAVNPINYENGSRFRNRYEDYYELSKYLAEKCEIRILFEIIYKSFE